MCKTGGPIAPDCPCNPAIAKPLSTAEPSNRDLYEILFEKEQADARRYTQLQESVTSVHQRITVHEEAHLTTARDADQKTETRLSTKTAGLVGFLGILATVITTVVKSVFFG